MVLDIGMEENTITLVEMDQVVISGEILILVKAIAINMVETIPKIKLNGTMIIVVIIIDKMVMEGDKLLQDHSQGALLGKEGCTQKELQVCALNTHV